MLDQLVSDFSAYLKVDVKNEIKPVEETIEDMLTRLDEFENIVGLVKVDSAATVDNGLPAIVKCKEQLDLICDKIDRLEQFVNRVQQDVDVMEARVSEAEACIGSQTKLKNIFKPLFFMKSSEGPSKKPCTMYVAPVTFQTADYFSSQQQVPSE